MKVTSIEVIPVAMEMPEPLRGGQRNGDQVGSLDGRHGLVHLGIAGSLTCPVP